MAPPLDELAGTVDRFGALTRPELRTALADLGARSGSSVDADGLDRAIDAAIETYYLLEVDGSAVEADGEGPFLVAGPTALPSLPPGAEDLPHLVDVEPRRVDRDAVAGQVGTRLRTDAAAAIDADAVDRAERLLDACYEVEAWGGVDLADVKAGLAGLLE